MHSKQGNHFSLCDPGDSQTVLPTTGALPIFPTGALGHTTLWLWPPELKTLRSTVTKNWRYWNPLLFPSQWFWGTVFLCSPLNVFSLPPAPPPLFLLLLLSGYSLWDQSSLPWVAPVALFSQESTLHSSYLPRVVFSLCRHAALSSKTSDWFQKQEFLWTISFNLCQWLTFVHICQRKGDHLLIVCWRNEILHKTLLWLTFSQVK